MLCIHVDTYIQSYAYLVQTLSAFTVYVLYACILCMLYTLAVSILYVCVHARYGILLCMHACMHAYMDGCRNHLPWAR